MASFGGFKIIPVCFDQSIKSPHLLYIKKHTHKNSNDVTPADQTVFVVNLPPYCEEKGLRNIFSKFGPIQSVFIQSSPGQVDEKKERKGIGCEIARPTTFQVNKILIFFKSLRCRNEQISNIYFA